VEGAEAHEGPHCLYVTLVIDIPAAAEVSWPWLSSIGPDDTTDKGDMQRCGARRNWIITLDTRDLFELFLLELLADTGGRHQWAPLCSLCVRTAVHYVRSASQPSWVV